MDVPTRTHRPGLMLALVAVGSLLTALPAAAQCVRLDAAGNRLPPIPNTPTSPCLDSAATWDGPLTGLLPAFFSDMAFTAPMVFNGDGIDHTQHFVRGLQTTTSGLALGQALAGQVTSFPIVVPAGSFLTEAGPGAGVSALTTRAPIGAERGTTLGRGKFAFGVSFHRAKVDAISDIDLDDGSVKLYAPHNDCCGPGANVSQPGNGTPAFERDVLSQEVGIELRQSVTSVALAVGLTDRIDVSAIVPLVRVDLNARVTSRIIRIGTTAPPATPTVHSFDGIDLANRTMSRSGTATGLGDVRVRTKWNLRRTDASAFAISLEGTLPTGDDTNFLGSGGTRVRAGLVMSGDTGAFSPFLNAGYTKSQGETAAEASTWPGALDPAVSARVSRTLSDEIDYAGGTSLAAAPWMTFNLEVIGRTMLDAPRFTLGGATGDELIVDAPGTVHRVLGMAGVRLRAGTRLLLTAGVALPIVDKGLRSKARPIVSLDYVF